jgi:glycosyltransferase involved in cell wall biosynthesis
MSTVSLQMIVKDEVAAVTNLLRDARHYFDAINITVSDKDAAGKLAKKCKATKNVRIVHRPWNDNFADARNANLEMCDTDYFFWIDADDEFDFSTIPKLVGLADTGKYDAIYLPYNYHRDEHGNTNVIHDRERLVRRDKGFTWRGVVHESLLVDEAFRGKKLSSPEVIHHAGDVKASMIRNHNILVRAVLGTENPDPRNIYYLGISYFGIAEYEKAIDMLNRYTQVGGWNEEIYRAFLKIAECYYMLNRYADSMQEALKAAGILPEYPDAYFALARFEYGMENWAECLEWIQVAFSKPVPETMSVRNPEMYEYAKLYSAVCHYELKHYRTALKHLREVAPYLSDELMDDFKRSANLETFIKILPNLNDFIPEDRLWTVLPESIKYDNRLREMRYRNILPTKWPKKSIVYFCGKGYEPWGANTLDKGMGGSEEAVVYLSREMANLGYFVTVFNECDEPYMDGNISYQPWRKFDPRDQFDNLVIWRAPDYAKHLVAEGVKANKILIDVHDVLSPEYVTDIPGVTYMVKSQYHRHLYDYLPDDKFVVIGNGIKVDQFNPTTVKGNMVGYFSAYYRGLETALKLWPKIRAQVPDAEFHVAYGWNSWVELEGENDFYHRVSKMLKDLEDQGVVHHDRLSHVELAKLMDRTQVWAYPTEFKEIHCITALKAQQARCYPVTTNVAALEETVQSGTKLDTRVIYTDEYQQKKFVNEVVKALKEAKTGTPVPGVDWSEVAKVWHETLSK